MPKNKRQTITLLAWIAVFLWMLLIFNLSSQVAEESDKISRGLVRIMVDTVEKVAPEADFDMSSFNHIVRKNAHFFAYLVLGMLVINAMRRRRGFGLRWHILALGICILYAASDEMHQLFVPGRGGQVIDIFIDSAGAFIGIILYWILGRIKHKLDKKVS